MFELESVDDIEGVELEFDEEIGGAVPERSGPSVCTNRVLLEICLSGGLCFIYIECADLE